MVEKLRIENLKSSPIQKLGPYIQKKNFQFYHNSTHILQPLDVAVFAPLKSISKKKGERMVL